MKKTLTTLLLTMISLVTSNSILTKINTIKTHLPVIKNNISESSSLFNNHYHYLNNDDWITNQSTVDNKFYSYDTSALKNYTFANARNSFFVDTQGNLVNNQTVNIPNKDKIDIENTKQEMITKRKIFSFKTKLQTNENYNFSNYQQNYFIGNNNWNYLQFGGLEKTINISAVKNANKITNNTHLAETLGLYYIAAAAITNKIDLTIADNISQEFIKKSSLSSQSSNSLATITTNIINIIYKNINIFKFINSSPLFSIIKNYSLNFIFDDVNTLVGVYYTKWNVGNITKNINYHYNNNFNNINSQNWTSSSDKQSILMWTNYAKNWEQFISLYPNFNFNNSKLTLTNINKNQESTNFVGSTNNITTNKTLKYELQNNYNMVIGYDNIIQLMTLQLYLFHDDKNIYWQWNATITSSPNLIAGCLLTINLDNISFQFQK